MPTAVAEAALFGTMSAIAVVVGVVALIMGDYGTGAFLVAAGGVVVVMTVADLRRPRGSADAKVPPNRLVVVGVALIALGAVLVVEDGSVADALWILLGAVVLTVGLIGRRNASQVR
jgi:ABC-type Fe3+-siderophore transport system permease subunit